MSKWLFHLSFSGRSEKCGKRPFWKRSCCVAGSCPFPAMCRRDEPGPGVSGGSRALKVVVFNGERGDTRRRAWPRVPGRRPRSLPVHLAAGAAISLAVPVVRSHALVRSVAWPGLRGASGDSRERFSFSGRK